MEIAGIRSRVVRWPIAGDGAARGRTERTSILVEITLPSGHRGLGEAAPLPGMSTDSLDEAAAAIAVFAAHRDEPLDVPTPSARFALDVPSPSARFALETAMLSARAAAEGRTLADVLATNSAVEGRARADILTRGPAVWLPCAVVVDDPESARAAVAAGARYLKIKVGPTGDLDRVIAIHHAAPHAMLRIDANRTWSRALTRPLLHALADLPIDFVEEPCPDAHELLSEPLPCMIALDESLVALTDDQLAVALRSNGLAALVLKPTVLGGLHACLALAARAAAAGKDGVVTHALEGPIGTAACAELALAIAGRTGSDLPAGLAPHAALAGWSHAVAQLGPTSIRRVALAPTPRLDQITVTTAAAMSAQHQTRVASAAGSATETAVVTDSAAASATATDSAAASAASAASAADSTTDSATDSDSDSAADSDSVADSASTSDSDFDSDSAASMSAQYPSVAAISTFSHARAPTRLLVATPTSATIDAIRTALDTRTPLALLHHRLPEAELARQRALVEAAQLPAGTAVVLFTSGSTGPARGVAISRTALEAAAAASAAHLGWRDEDRWLLALSTAHAGGLAIVVRCHLAGKPIVLLDGDFERDRCAALLVDCTLASLVPTQLAALLDDRAWRPPPKLRAVLLGGAAASPALLERAAARNVPFLTSYGLTETFGQIATAPIDRAADPRAPLRLLAGVEVIAGTRAEPAPIAIRAPMLATSYLDGTPIAPRFTTADLGFVADGALHVVGRIDDVIVSGGEKVHPSVVEAELVATPGVRAACVFAVPDPRWGQTVGAVLAVDAGFDEERAAERWTTTLAPHARPRELAIAVAVPLLPSGKVDRRQASLLARHALHYRR